MSCFGVLFCLLASLPGEELYLDGHQAEDHGNYLDAAVAYETCASKNGPLAGYAKARAAHCRGLARHTTAAKAAFAALSQDPSPMPWRRMAVALYAELEARIDEFEEAVGLYESALAGLPDLWWVFELRWCEAENKLEVPDKSAEGYAYFRRVMSETQRWKERMGCARLLAESPNIDDQFAAVRAMIRSSAYTESIKVMTRMSLSAAPESLLRDKWLFLGKGKFQTDEEREHGLELLSRENPVEQAEWARLWMAYSIRRLTGQGHMPEAEVVCALLLSNHGDSEEAADALYWMGGGYARTGQPGLAISYYAKLLNRFPEHRLADDAVLAAAGLAEEHGDYRAAIEGYNKFCDMFADSPLYAEAAYHLGRVHEREGHKEKAVAAYVRAAECLGRYHAHRALLRLSILTPDNPLVGPLVTTNTKGPLLNALNVDRSADVVELTSLRETEQYRRLRFFAMHGMMEAEWEALDWRRSAKESELGALYAAMAEVGLVHSAMEWIENEGWGETEQGISLARRRIQFPKTYWPLVQKAAKSAEVDPFLILAVSLQESTFRPALTSSAGAQGLMQVMPSTAKWLAKVDDQITLAQALDQEEPENAYWVGGRYLGRMMERSEGNVVHALISYNAGPGNRDKWVRRFSSVDDDEFIELIPYEETKDYVKRVLGNYAAYRSLYGDESKE